MLTRSRQGWVGCDGGEEIQSTQQVTERFESQRTGERRRGEGIERRSKRGGVLHVDFIIWSFASLFTVFVTLVLSGEGNLGFRSFVS